MSNFEHDFDFHGLLAETRLTGGLVDDLVREAEGDDRLRQDMMAGVELEDEEVESDNIDVAAGADVVVGDDLDVDIEETIGDRANLIDKWIKTWTDAVSMLRSFISPDSSSKEQKLHLYKADLYKAFVQFSADGEKISSLEFMVDNDPKPEIMRFLYRTRLPLNQDPVWKKLSAFLQSRIGKPTGEKTAKRMITNKRIEITEVDWTVKRDQFPKEDVDEDLIAARRLAGKKNVITDRAFNEILDLVKKNMKNVKSFDKGARPTIRFEDGSSVYYEEKSGVIGVEAGVGAQKREDITRSQAWELVGRLLSGNLDLEMNPSTRAMDRFKALYVASLDALDRTLGEARRDADKRTDVQKYNQCLKEGPKNEDVDIDEAVQVAKYGQKLADAWKEIQKQAQKDGILKSSLKSGLDKEIIMRIPKGRMKDNPEHYMVAGTMELKGDADCDLSVHYVESERSASLGLVTSVAGYPLAELLKLDSLKGVVRILNRLGNPKVKIKSSWVWRSDNPNPPKSNESAAAMLDEGYESKLLDAWTKIKDSAAGYGFLSQYADDRPKKQRVAGFEALKGSFFVQEHWHAPSFKVTYFQNEDFAALAILDNTVTRTDLRKIEAFKKVADPVIKRLPAPVFKSSYSLTWLIKSPNSTTAQSEKNLAVQMAVLFEASSSARFEQMQFTPGMQKLIQAWKEIVEKLLREGLLAKGNIRQPSDWDADRPGMAWLKAHDNEHTELSLSWEPHGKMQFGVRTRNPSFMSTDVGSVVLHILRKYLGVPKFGKVSKVKGAWESVLEVK